METIRSRMLVLHRTSFFHMKRRQKSSNEAKKEEIKSKKGSWYPSIVFRIEAQTKRIAQFFFTLSKQIKDLRMPYQKHHEKQNESREKDAHFDWCFC